jgi:hypothetical protein
MSGTYHADILPAANHAFAGWGGANTWEDIGIGAGIVGAGALGLGALGALPAAAAAPAAAGAVDAAAAGAPLDILASSPAAAFAPSAVGDILAPSIGGGALASGLALDPTFASSVPAALGGTTAIGGAPAAGSLDALATGVPAGTTPAAAASPAASIGAAPAATVASTAPTGAAPIDLASQAAQGGATTAAGATPAASTASPGLLSTVGSDVKAALPYLSAGALGYNILNQYELNKAIPSLSTTAQQTEQAATSLANQGAAANAAAQPYLAQGNQWVTAATNGTLLPADQAALQAQVQAAIAQVTQGYASRGMSTNPEQNSSLAQDIQSIQNQAQVTTSQILQGYASTGTQITNTANSLLNSGASDTAISGQLANSVSQLSTSLAQTTGSAIANFAAALAGKVGGGVTLKLAS